MANVDHTSLNDTQCHEPKGINSATTADAGKVITPSGTSSGVSALRKLTQSDLNSATHNITLTISDISTSDTRYIAWGHTGTVTKVTAVTAGQIDTTGSDATITVNVDGSTSDAGTITVAASSSATGSVYSLAPTSNNVLTNTSYIKISTDGASTNTVDTTFVIEVQGDGI